MHYGNLVGYYGLVIGHYDYIMCIMIKKLCNFNKLQTIYIKLLFSSNFNVQNKEVIPISNTA